MPIAKTSLCRFSQAAHYKSRHWSPVFSNRNFMRERAPTIFALCRRAGPGRNDVALRPTWFRVIMIMPPGSDKLVQGRHHAMLEILAFALLCCAFSGEASDNPAE